MDIIYQLDKGLQYLNDFSQMGKYNYIFPIHQTDFISVY